MAPKQPPYCFGKLDNVFPLADDGLRHSPESCFVCRCKTECLRTALAGSQGLVVESEKVDRAYSAGVIGFFSRWSKRKTLHRKAKEEDTGGGRET